MIFVSIRELLYAVPPAVVHQPLFTSMFTKGVHQRRSPHSLVHHFGSPLWFTTSVHQFTNISESKLQQGGGNNRKKFVKNNNRGTHCCGMRAGRRDCLRLCFRSPLRGVAQVI